MAKVYKSLILLGFLLTMWSLPLQASHIRAGEITVRRIDPQRPVYEITVTAYCDAGSSILFGQNGLLDFGDGTSEPIANRGEGTEDWVPRTRISEETWKYELTRIHTFPAQKSYKISYREEYRNEEVINMDDPGAMPFYVETVIVIDGFLGVNNTPILLVPPVDKAAIGKRFIHNPGAYDVDGDSLSYRMVVCKQAEDIPVANYRFPHETFPEGDPRNGTSITGGEPTFTLNSLTGDLIWDAPGTQGEYNAAFLVEEWRKVDGEYEFLGYVTRDMQIKVEETENEPPVLNIPKDTCIVAGTRLDAEIFARDPDGDQVKMESYSGVYSLGATYSPNDGQYQDVPAKMSFSWQTDCSHVQERPYTIHFKATDARAGVSLTDIQTWNVTVIAPPPSISSVRMVNNRTVDVNFNAGEYLCNDDSLQVQVWRRTSSNDFDPGFCETGMPAGMGYHLVGMQMGMDFPFRDQDGGQGLAPGATYCYRLVAVLPNAQNSESVVSEELCITIPAAAPVITHVSIEETDEENGEILVRWTPPIEIDQTNFPPPYMYDVYRAEGFTGGTYERIAENLSDTTFMDSGLDTRNGIYNYYILFKSGGTEVDRSASASTVRLTPEPLVGGIQLNWAASVPWSNSVEEAPYHYIYRNNIPGESAEAFVLIDSVDLSRTDQFAYLDTGEATGEGSLSDAIEYCYYITTSGSYQNPLLLSPLLNNSQKVCVQPNDTIPPCGPVAFELKNLLSCEEIISQSECGVNNFENRLEWTMEEGSGCQDDIAYWEVYFSPSGEDGSFEVVGTTSGTSFVHEDLRSLAGYYFLVAVDRSGNRSEPSNLVQNDNCPNYWLPNVFTPNNDDVNDTFGAPLNATDNSRCPRFVEAVIFKVFNRWGKEVFTYDTQGQGSLERSVYIHWNGQDNNGNMVSAGTYYYIANVTFDVLDPARREKEFRGWIQIVMGDNEGSNVSGSR